MKKGVQLAVSIIAAVLALVLVGLAIIFFRGNQITVARCIVNERNRQPQKTFAQSAKSGVER